MSFPSLILSFLSFFSSSCSFSPSPLTLTFVVSLSLSLFLYLSFHLVRSHACALWLCDFVTHFVPHLIYVCLFVSVCVCERERERERERKSVCV